MWTVSVSPSGICALDRGHLMTRIQRTVMSLSVRSVYDASGSLVVKTHLEDDEILIVDEVHETMFLSDPA
jgi:hypothetical protein